MNIKDVTLGKMAVASLLFNTLTPYNPSLTDFRSVVGSTMDLSIQEHRDALMNWLNNWGCRHLSKEQHQVASASIFDWYQSNFGTLFGDKMSLWQLDSQDIETAAKVYGSLKDKTGAWRMGGNSKRKVHIGPTAASKILFAIRPSALMPWDDAMRKDFGCDGSPESYFNYLSEIRDLTLHVADLCKNKGFQIDDLPRKLGRSESTVLELVNEYIWVTVTRKVKLPSSKTLTDWAALS